MVEHILFIEIYIYEKSLHLKNMRYWWILLVGFTELLLFQNEMILLYDHRKPVGFRIGTFSGLFKIGWKSIFGQIWDFVKLLLYNMYTSIYILSIIVAIAIYSWCLRHASRSKSEKFTISPCLGISQIASHFVNCLVANTDCCCVIMNWEQKMWVDYLFPKVL